MSNIRDIVDVQIQVEKPAAASSAFEAMLIIGPGPTSGRNTPPDVGVYTALKEIGEAGWGPEEPIYLAATVAFAQSPKPAHIYVAVQKQIEAVTEEVGVTLDRALQTPGWYAIAPVGVEASSYDKIATWAEENEKLVAFTTMAIANPLSSGTYLRSLAIYGKVSALESATPATNAYAHVAMLAKGLSYEVGSETWTLKTLSVIEPSVLTGDEVAQLNAAHLNYFVASGGKNVIQGGKTLGGEWIDVIRFCDWQKNDIQMAVFNLFVTKPKVPYTDEGIALIQNEMIASLTRGQDRGGIFRNDFDKDGVLIPGFTTSVPLAVDVPSTDKAERVLRSCTFTARLAGAIHLAKITGRLVY